MSGIHSVLAVGAHPDDIELGCGGSLAKFVEAGARVRALVFSDGTVGNRSGADRVQETREALRLLGVTDIHTLAFPDTRLEEHHADLISAIERNMKEVQPERVYTMFEHDRHQDHRAVFQASIVACRAARQILCYETPSSWTNFQPEVFEDISDTLERKIAALALHKSQRDRVYTQPAAMRNSAEFRGQQVSVSAAEAFIGYKIVL